METDMETDMETETVLRLNLGSGEREIDGWRSIDRKLGSEVYPLPSDIADGSVEEIRASHVLEHFGHQQVPEVLRHWVQKLRPGGRIAIAVPNFEVIARNYLDGTPFNVQGYTFGGQTDENDYHKAGFDFEALRDLMVDAGLERIARWSAPEDHADCSQLPISLNLVAYKPAYDTRKIENVHAVLAHPRFGPVIHARSTYAMIHKLNIPCVTVQGCFWHQILSEAIETIIANERIEYVLTLDFDTIYTPAEVLEIYRLMQAFPEADAICSLQSKRGAEHALFGLSTGPDGKPRTILPREKFRRPLLKILTGHFGLTLLRANKLRLLPRPWMQGAPNPAGRWDEGKRDPDIMFWHKWNDAGNSLYLANRVVVGHLEEMIVWPDGEFKPHYQSVSDYFNGGRPTEIIR